MDTVQDAPGLSSIERLSLEIKQKIASYLCPVRKASLILCSQSFMSTIGTECWQKVSENKIAKSIFFTAAGTRLKEPIVLRSLLQVACIQRDYVTQGRSNGSGA